MSRTIALFVAAAALGILSASPRDASAHCDRPTLLIVLDSSSSMVAYSVPSGETRWQAVMAALGSVLDGFREDIDFGLMVFPYPDGCTPGRVVIDPAPGTVDAIFDYIATPPLPPPANSTPMAQTLREAASYPPLSDPSKRRAAVLVTDGNEWCYPYDPAARFNPVEAAAAVRATGTEMYVIGMGGEGVDALVLNRIASESGTAVSGCDPAQEDALASNNCFHQAGDIPSLTAALETIARRVTSEICDGLDNDCDGTADEELAQGCLTACGTGTESCAGGRWSSCTARFPSAEICDGAADEDCDGVVDEGCACAEGVERACGAQQGACRQGLQRCEGGAWGECTGGIGPAAEVCNGIDDDCNGTADEGCECIEGAAQPCGSRTGECRPGLMTCGGGMWSACEGEIGPGEEVCDGLDNDCSGVVDNNAICPGDEMCIRGACILVEQEEVPGCGCRTAGDAGGRAPALALLMLLVGLLARPLSRAPRRG